MQDKIKQYNVIVQDLAVKMLGDHAEFLAGYSETASDRLLSEFQKRVDSLEILPERCPWLDDPNIERQKYRKLLFEKHYLMIFRIEENAVYIDAVVDCHQDYGWLIP